MPRHSRMDETDIQAIVQREIRAATTYIDSEITQEQVQALDFYLGKPFGKDGPQEIDGRSQVVSMDVQDTVESILPDLLEIFEGGDNVVEYMPTGEKDEAVATQATEYANYVWRVDNNGFENSYSWIKDALIQKVGVLKCWWDDTPVTKKESYTGINRLRLEELLDDEEIEVVEQEERDAETEEERMFAPDGKLYDISIVRTTMNGRIRVEPVPPENFGISRQAACLDDARIVFDRRQATISELIEEGYDPELLAGIPSHGQGDMSQGHLSRHSDQEFAWTDHNALDESMREVWVYDSYLKMDRDGDGISSWHQVVTGGEGHTLLDVREVEDHPYEAITPIPTPHKFHGRAVADLVKDIQRVKSTVLRQLMDNMYLQNNARALLSSSVNMDDWLLNRPGGAVRVSSPTTQGAYEPIVTTPIAQHAMPVLEYWDHIRGQRTGETQYSQGLDSEALNKTASGMNMILGQSQRRKLLIARCFAEMGYAKIFRKILRLIVANQDRPRMIRLRNQWVPVDPRSWNAEMDVSISVGLGHGSKDQQAAQAQQLLLVQEKALQYQGGLEGPFVTPDEMYNGLKAFTKAMGYKNPDPYFKDPEGQPPPPPKEDPKVQLEKAKLQADMQVKQAEMQMKREEAELDRQNDIRESQEQIRLERERFQNEMQMKWMEFAADMKMEFLKMSAQMGLQQQKVQSEIAAAEAKTGAEIEQMEKQDDVSEAE